MGRDLKRARTLSPQAWADLATAAAELALARIRIQLQGADRLVRDRAAAAKPTVRPADQRMIERVAFAVPRAGSRVPWHSTCLVQAVAAQHWLKRKGIVSSIRLGARKEAASVIDAHAWLEANGRVVIGGDVADYTPFTEPRGN